VKLDDLGQPGKAVTIGAGISQWVLSADSKRLYYLKGFNYGAGGAASGTLTMTAFPPTVPPVETTLVPTKVGGFIPIGDTDIDGGVAYFDARSGMTSLKVIRDPTRPDMVLTAAPTIAGTLAVSRDLRFVYYYRQIDGTTRTSDGYIARTDVASPPCTLTTSGLSDRYGVPFSANGALVFWADNVDVETGTGEGWVGNPDGCTAKHQWTEDIDFWFIHESNGMIFSDALKADTASLSYVGFPDGKSVGKPTVIQPRAGRIYGVLPDFGAVLYTIPRIAPAKDGIYLYSRINLAGAPGTDGGSTDSTPASPPDTGIDTGSDTGSGQ
jgi:hypothetical protein